MVFHKYLTTSAALVAAGLNRKCLMNLAAVFACFIRSIGRSASGAFGPKIRFSDLFGCRRSTERIPMLPWPCHEALEIMGIFKDKFRGCSFRRWRESKPQDIDGCSLNCTSRNLHTPLKFNNSPLKRDHPRRKVPFQPSFFQGRTVHFQAVAPRKNRQLGWEDPFPFGSSAYSEGRAVRFSDINVVLCIGPWWFTGDPHLCWWKRREKS